jgi:predicted phosphodiesterase
VVRAAAVLAVLTLLAVYFGISESLPDLGLWADVAFVGLLLIPAFFSLTWLALPLWRMAPTRALGGAVVALVVLAVLFELVGLDVAANFVKFAAVTAAGWWFLAFFESISWVLLVALLIIPVDTYSVFQGPTKVIVEEQPQIFDALSIAFPIPGEHNSAQLGLPDVLFFALFLGAAVRFGLRPGLTWTLMALSFAATLALAVAFDISGLPALPLLSAAFILANADLIWKQVRPQRHPPPPRPTGVRVAALYDIHGNLPALEAVLAEVAALRVDVILVGGDIAIGPMPRATLTRLLGLRQRPLFVRGNGDREIAAGTTGESDLWEERTRWSAAQLEPGQRAWLAALPATRTVYVDGLGPVLFCHGSPRSDDEILTAVSPEQRVAAALAGVDETIVVCGHTHAQFDRWVSGKRLVNAGSVGMPYEAEPGAYWALLGPEVELRRTAYDLEAAAEAIRATGFPGADALAAENVIAVPSAEEATDRFEAMARAADEPK